MNGSQRRSSLDIDAHIVASLMHTLSSRRCPHSLAAQLITLSTGKLSAEMQGNPPPTILSSRLVLDPTDVFGPIGGDFPRGLTRADVRLEPRECDPLGSQRLLQLRDPCPGFRQRPGPLGSQTLSTRARLTLDMEVVVRALLLALLCLLPALPTLARADTPPDIIVILLDDMRTASLLALPETQALLEDGKWFENFILTTLICCPSRASLLTGRYAHNHGAIKSDGKGWERFRRNEATALPVLLPGYETALIGKYLNGYGRMPRPRPAGTPGSRTGSAVVPVARRLQHRCAARPGGGVPQAGDRAAVPLVRPHDRTDPPPMLPAMQTPFLIPRARPGPAAHDPGRRPGGGGHRPDDGSTLGPGLRFRPL